MATSTRRRFLAGIAVTAPATWSTPTIKSVVLPAHAQTSGTSQSEDSQEETAPCAGSLNFSELVLTHACSEQTGSSTTERFGIYDGGECPEWRTGVSAIGYPNEEPLAGVGKFDDGLNSEVLRAWVVVYDSNSSTNAFSFDRTCGAEHPSETGTFEFPSSSGDQQWQLSYAVDFTADQVTLTLSNLVRV